MAILEITVFVSVGTPFDTYYEDLGYKIPRKKDKKGRIVADRRQKILVKVNDLPKGSNIKLTKICDYCLKEIKNQRYADILRDRDYRGKDSCKNCHGEKLSEILSDKEIPEGLSLAERYPQLITEWDTERNGKTAWEVYAHSGINSWWICQNNPEHRYDMTIDRKTKRNHKCPYCSNYRVDNSNCLATTHPELAKEWHPTKNGDLTPYDVVYGSNKNVWWLGQCNHEWEAIIVSRTKGHGCELCVRESRRGEGHHNWKGGISSIHEYLRKRLIKWKNDSMKYSNFKCILTGDNFDVIHHQYGFDLILQQALNETKLELKENISNYSDSELKNLENKCLEIHYRYPLGVCLRADVHNLFHELYGRGSNTPEQFEEFKIRWDNGEFKIP